MSEHDRITVRISGGVSGQVAAGRDIHQQYVRTEQTAVTEADRDQVRELVAALKELVAAEAPVDKREVALGQLDDLEDAVLDDEPDVGTLMHVRNWFRKRLPHLVGPVTKLIVNPVVGKVVEAAGDLAASEFRSMIEHL